MGLRDRIMWTGFHWASNRSTFMHKLNKLQLRALGTEIFSKYIFEESCNFRESIHAKNMLGKNQIY
jgi:hypothetical protein